MKVLGVSLTTIIMFVVIWFVARRYGSAIPLLNRIG